MRSTHLRCVHLRTRIRFRSLRCFSSSTSMRITHPWRIYLRAVSGVPDELLLPDLEIRFSLRGAYIKSSILLLWTDGIVGARITAMGNSYSLYWIIALFLLSLTGCRPRMEETMDRKVAPYGSWVSPITEEALVEGRISLGQTAIDGPDIYWLESRPQEAGRTTIMKRDEHGEIHELLPAPGNARSRVHEYGGGSMMVHEGTVYYSEMSDQRIWQIRTGMAPSPLTAEGNQRFADAVMDKTRQRLICIRENHEIESGQPINEVVAVPLDGSPITVLVSGSDFYAAPRLNPSGTHLAWLSWNHPNMPWDHTELSTAAFDASGNLGESKCVAGETEESVIQPVWADNDGLLFISDRDEWWNLYSYRGGETTALHPMEAEFGKPQWGFRTDTYGLASYNRLITMYGTNGNWKLAGLDAKTRSMVDYRLPYTTMDNLSVAENTAVFVGSAPLIPSELVLLDLNSGMTQVIKRSSPKDPDPRYTSEPQAVTFPTAADKEAHGFYYPPKNDDYAAPERTFPPMITIVHGGPTSATTSSFRLTVQYWTSRGFAVFDVNHGGSTGYGRTFRNRLRDMWGVVDVEDASHGARYLASQGKADPDKLIIRGGSAGGYTTLAALAFHNTFKAGASYYGISDLSLLAEETHKFESRYPERLLGPYPESRDVYESRSPIHHLDGLNRPVILLQGLEDKVVPPNQAERILDALKARGIPVAYVAFPEEAHGFRKAENIIRAYQSELYFYARVFGFDPPDGLEAIEIFNLPQ